MLPYQNDVLSRSELLERARTWKKANGRIVFTNGCFDLLHVGHLKTLWQAKAEGDYLVVGLNSDTSVRRLKGPSRPLNSEQDRATILAALKCVDAVTIFAEETPIALLAALQPDVHVKGGDYRLEDLPEAATIQSYGGKIVLVQVVPGRSTSSLIEKSRQP